MFSRFESDRLSWFRTSHEFLNYAEITSRDDYVKAISSRDASSPICMLGNGSNCLFARKTVKTFLLKNKLPKKIDWQSDNLLWASSSVPLMLVLKECKQRSLDSFFYLSSVPATIGGAIAMNAGRGRGHNKTIFDFVEQVVFWTPDGQVSLPPEEIKRDYRNTVFLENPDWFISNILFRFPVSSTTDSENPISERVKYSQEVQDHSGPNCGSVFKSFHPKLLGRLRGVKFKGALFSAKTQNWITNHSKSSIGVLWLMRLAIFLHFILLKKCSLEIRVIK